METNNIEKKNKRRTSKVKEKKRRKVFLLFWVCWYRQRWTVREPISKSISIFLFVRCFLIIIGNLETFINNGCACCCLYVLHDTGTTERKTKQKKKTKWNDQLNEIKWIFMHNSLLLLFFFMYASSKWALFIEAKTWHMSSQKSIYVNEILRVSISPFLFLFSCFAFFHFYFFFVETLKPNLQIWKSTLSLFSIAYALMRIRLSLSIA